MEIEELIASRPKGRQRQAEWYRKLIQTADEAGLSPAELASRASCSLGTIYNWRRRLTAVAAPTSDVETRIPGLVRVHAPAAPPLSALKQSYEVRLTCGRSVLVPPQFDRATLADLMETLEQC